ncbi:MAG: hypothetical protein E7483_01350 [Ruminococcaceae bacterium]|nr:hypothetical protein [Oscillospiraceae bacterium]
MTFDQRNCKDFLNQNKLKFGITEPGLASEYLDICAKNVRCIASRRIDEKIVLPSMSSFINSCTGLVDCAGGIDTQFASLRVTHASEELVDCDTNCPGVKVIIKGQIIVRTKSCNSCCAPSYMAIPVQLCSEVIRDFYCAANGERVPQLKNELPNIDGSCMVINLNCRVYREVCNGCSRYVAHIRGSVVDKLWKLENVWIEGIRPYPAPSINILDRFDRDICTCLDDRDYISLNGSGTNCFSTANADCGGNGCGYNGGCDCTNSSGCANNCCGAYSNSCNTDCGGANCCAYSCGWGNDCGCSNSYTGDCGNGCANDCGTYTGDCSIGAYAANCGEDNCSCE